jgi:hypothetical protein
VKRRQRGLGISLKAVRMTMDAARMKLFQMGFRCGGP